MSYLYSSKQIGSVQIKNRFVHSATFEAMATATGEVTDQLIKRYQLLAENEIGLIIPGFFYIHPMGKAFPFQSGIHNDDMIPGLKRLIDRVHQKGGKIVLQLCHAGRQTTKRLIGARPLGPSSFDRDPLNMVKPASMNKEEIQEAIDAFGEAAKRAVLAGADGIQFHGAHGYLINQFLSPFFNRRIDEWGGTDEKRFRFFKEVISATRKKIPGNIPLLVKLNSNDYTPKEGVMPALAVKYAIWLSELKIDGLELSCGTSVYSFMNMCRGEVPVNEFVSGLPWWKKSLGRFMIKRMVGKYDLEDAYNVEAAKIIKPVLKNTTLSVVGGFRKQAYMEEVITKGYTDLISMSRPFIREPDIIQKFKQGKADTASCTSCNKCLVAVCNGIPLRCFNKVPNEDQ
jgi:2,4-dienoyl-CoA reductase-like NADH-dependent reductase (Old Yellow Enzyme family)